MQKVLVTEIGSETTVVNAFGDLDTGNPRLLGQGLSSSTVLEGDGGSGLRSAVIDLEKDIGPVGSLGEFPLYVTSSVPIRHDAQGVKEQLIQDVSYMQEILQVINGRILPTSGAIMQAAQLIYEEVGNVLVLHVGGASTDVYSVTLTSQPLAQRTVGEDLGVFTNALTLVKLMGENIIKEHHGQDWEKLLTSRPETLEEIALSAEITAAAVTIALQRHCGQTINYDEATGKLASVEVRDLTGIRWIVGTGVVLTQLPNGLEIMRESIKGMAGALSPQEGIAMFLDKDGIMGSVGVLTTTFRSEAWQLLRESFGVEN